MRRHLVWIAAVCSAIVAPHNVLADSFSPRNLIGTWSCRTTQQDVQHYTYRFQDGAVVQTEADPQTPSDVAQQGLRWIDRFDGDTLHLALGLQRFSAGPSQNGTYEGQVDGAAAAVRYDAMPNGFRRLFTLGANAGNVTGEACRRGDDAPGPDACIAPNVTATTLQAAEPAMPRLAAQQGIQGTVTLVVTLGEGPHPTAVRVISSPSVLLNNAAVAAAKNSSFRAATDSHCAPVSGTYSFLVMFTARRP